MAAPAQFFDMAGLPVSLGYVEGCKWRCAVWTDRGVQPMQAEGPASHWKPIKEAEWRAMIAAARGVW